MKVKTKAERGGSNPAHNVHMSFTLRSTLFGLLCPGKLFKKPGYCLWSSNFNLRQKSKTDMTARIRDWGYGEWGSGHGNGFCFFNDAVRG